MGYNKYKIQNWRVYFLDNEIRLILYFFSKNK